MRADRTVQLFRNDREVICLGKKNRFLVRVTEAGAFSGEFSAAEASGAFDAHLANSGSLAELLVPGTPLILERAPESARGRRKTGWTAVAVRYKGKVVPLVSVRANDAARRMLIPQLFPEAQRVRPEYTVGESRFDFLVEENGIRHYVEIKSCTLCELGRAMFPDAPTERGRRHVEHLARLSSGPAGPSPSRAIPSAVISHVIFVLHHEDARVFTPHIHTDPAFSLSLESAASSGAVRVHAVSLRCGESGECEVADAAVPVDFAPVGHVHADRGAYLVMMEFHTAGKIRVGALGELELSPGFYLYAGSARRGLSARTARHLRRGKKKLRWHIDYLTESSDRTRVFPVYNGGDIECDLARGLATIGGLPVPRFGAGDCGCPTHLYRFGEDPMEQRQFLDLLLSYRHGALD